MQVVLKGGLQEEVKHCVPNNEVEVFVHASSQEQEVHNPGPNLKLL